AALRALVAAMAGAHLVQLAEATHVALAPGGDAVAQPVLLALDRLAELVLLQLLRLQNLVAPGLEVAEAPVQPARLAAIEPDGGVGDLFEEAAVVRDDDEGRAGRLQLA